MKIHFASALLVLLLLLLATTLPALAHSLLGAEDDAGTLHLREPAPSSAAPHDRPRGLVKRLLPPHQHTHTHGHGHGRGHGGYVKPTPSAPPLPAAPPPGGLQRAYGMPTLPKSSWESISRKATKKRKFATMMNG